VHAVLGIFRRLLSVVADDQPRMTVTINIHFSSPRVL
jgi:hypothetical protein